jgi:hypothetical protein
MRDHARLAVEAMTTLHEAPVTTTAVVTDDHNQIDAALARVTDAIDGPTRELLLAYDKVVGLLSRHLIGMEVAVCPVLADLMPDGRHAVREHVAAARRLEWNLREMGQVIWGDALAPYVPLEALHRAMLAQMAAHRAEEEELLAALDASLPPGECETLGRKLQHATLHAPTRPHPHAVQRLIWTRALYRPVAGFDKMLDTINARSIPAPRYGQRRRRPVGLWGSYLLGVPLADGEPDEESRGGDASNRS